MSGIRKRGEDIRDFIMNNITDHKNIAALTAQQFEISLPAVYKHIDRLVSENHVIKKSGRYILNYLQYKYDYTIGNIQGEDAVWENDIKKHFAGVSKNIRYIWTYGFLEMLNNAIEHSKGKEVRVLIDENKIYTAITICDDGIGVFNNIKAKFHLNHERDALLELAKGKRTTAPKRHSGQGIFFSSKAFDDFLIISNGITFNPNSKRTVPLKTGKRKFSTLVYMRLAHNSNKILKDVFDLYSTEKPGDFDKTIIPVRMANSDDLVSRSQARRVLSGLELFKEVILDFTDIEYIGQAFADEIFRVFISMNPNTSITAQNANADIQNMINRAVKTKL